MDVKWLFKSFSIDFRTDISFKQVSMSWRKFNMQITEARMLQGNRAYVSIKKKLKWSSYFITFKVY